MSRMLQFTAPRPFKTPWAWSKGLLSVCAMEYDKGRLCICGSVSLMSTPGVAIPNTELMPPVVKTPVGIHMC